MVRNRPLTTGLDAGQGQGPGVAHFAVFAEDALQFLRRVRIQHVGCRWSIQRVHPHIQFGLEAVAESALGGVQLVAAHPEIGEDAIHRTGPHHFGAQLAFQKPEIGVHKLEAGVLGKSRLLRIALRIFILVKSKQAAFAAQLFQYFPGMAAAAKSGIHVRPFGANAEGRYGFGKQDGCMVHFLFKL